MKDMTQILVGLHGFAAVAYANAKRSCAKAERNELFPIRTQFAPTISKTAPNSRKFDSYSMVRRTSAARNMNHYVERLT